MPRSLSAGAAGPSVRAVSPVPGSVVWGHSSVVEKGRTKRTCGIYLPGMLQGVGSIEDFAATLCVPVKAILLILPTNQLCRVDGCFFHRIEGNGNKCPLHQRTWYPLQGSRGGDLLGPEFLRASVGKSHRDCDCDSPFCRSAGYFPGQGALSIATSGHTTVLSTPNLLSQAKKDSYFAKVASKRRLFLYPWHFLPEHRKKDDDGRWRLLFDRKNKTKFKDREKYTYDFPPPRWTPRAFLEEEYFASYIRPQDRWVNESTVTSMPRWMLNMIALDSNNAVSDPARTPPVDHTTYNSIPHLRRHIEMWKARSYFLQDQLTQQKQSHIEQLADTKRKYEDIINNNKCNIQSKDNTINELKTDNARLEKELERVQEKLHLLQQRKGQPLRYADMYAGGILSNNVHSFTLFDTIEQNDAFLDIINFADGSDGSFDAGDGLCENLRCYSKIDMKERSGCNDPPSLNHDSDEYMAYLRKRRAAMKGSMTWKDDYFAFCLYVRAGTTQSFAASIVGISVGRMSDVFHEWAQVLDTALCQMFPRPSRRQMLRAFPAHFIEKDGHVRAFLLLDGFEIFTQQSSNVNVASSTHSDYKKHCTVKFLGGVDPIGCPWNGTVPDGNPGRISDVMATVDTKILREVPFGHTCKVDKGFIIDNEASREGVIIDRPQKRLKKQIQQTAVDTAQTQKIGNTRIIVENVNGEMKEGIRYLNVLIPTLQFGIISKIVRIGYLMQNFKKAIIQNKDPHEADPTGGRPCRAEIRWYGATDTGLRDVRDNIRLWGLQCEIERFDELVAMEEHKNKSAIEIADLILDERWDLKQRKEMYLSVHGIEYNGGDL